MLKISTVSNSTSLTLTGSHVLFRESSTGSIESVYTSQLVEGDRLVRPNMEGKHDLDEVLAIQTVSEEIGYWAPLTQDGTLLVNGLLVSCYASFPHHQSQLAYALVKTFPTLLLDNEVSQHEDGVRHVVTLVKKIGEFVGLRRKVKPEEVENSFDKRPTIANQRLLQVAHYNEL